ncbi:hypothetical protein, conserved [Eimeria acervulina]|uniref:Uncharacterized protein n=1 Tax=Eimeria acervulina TaxID=5801 RepID=U6GE49_EIMAC|nr:hypothetical protein, conserved [Eimeria acervulina]CDI78440.1 hypothetical protein, conserved [Eimeria acervulina]
MTSALHLRCLVSPWEAAATSLRRLPATAAATPGRAAAAAAAESLEAAAAACYSQCLPSPLSFSTQRLSSFGCNTSVVSSSSSSSRSLNNEFLRSRSNRRRWLVECGCYPSSSSSSSLFLRSFHSSISSPTGLASSSTSSNVRSSNSGITSSSGNRRRIITSMCHSSSSSSSSMSSCSSRMSSTRSSRNNSSISSISMNSSSMSYTSSSMSSSSSSMSSSSTSMSSSSSSSSWWRIGGIRLYRTRINWMRVRFRARVSYFLRKSLKPKNHSKVLTRFRLTRFGWERLRKGRNGKKFNLTAKQFKHKYSIAYVSRHDLKKFKYQTPGYKLRIRDPPIDTNPNIQSIRKHLPAYFG